MLPVIQNLIKRCWQVPRKTISASRKTIQHCHLPVNVLKEEPPPLKLLFLLISKSPSHQAFPATPDTPLFPCSVQAELAAWNALSPLHLSGFYASFYTQLKYHILHEPLPENLNQKLSHRPMKSQSTVCWGTIYCKYHVLHHILALTCVSLLF